MSTLKIEIAYCLPEQQILIELEVKAPCRIAEALQQAISDKRLPPLDIESLALGIFSQPATLDTLVKAGDRIEIYRPLIIDPKTARRLRAK